MSINTEDVRGFFDSLAESWDGTRCENPDKIREILRLADITPGVCVLDVACGTGVLFPYYLELGAARITGIDLSPEMIRIASGKYSDPRISLVCGDVEKLDRGHFDRIVVFNALPHFPDPARLIATLASSLSPGGRLTIAHDRCRASINGWHEQTATSVSLGLPSAETAAGWFRPLFDVDVILDGDDRYVVSGVLKNGEVM